MDDKFFTRKDVMDRLHVSKTTIERLEAKNKLIGVRGFGRNKLYLESDVEKLADELFERLNKRKEAAKKLESI